MGVSLEKDPWFRVRQKILNYEYKKAIEELEKKQFKKKKKKVQKHFTLGMLYFKQNEIEKAENNFKEALNSDDPLLSYTHYYLGLIKNQKSDFKKSRVHFKKSKELKPNRFINSWIYFFLGELALKEKDFSESYKYFRKFEKRWKGDFENHPKVLWQLAHVDLLQNKKWRACRWIRKLYSRYPTYKEVIGWNLNSQTFKVSDFKPKCTTTIGDREKRIRYLFWSGVPRKAYKEVSEISKDDVFFGEYNKDYFQAFLLNLDGYPKESLDILLKYQKTQNKSYKYLNFLAVTAAKANKQKMSEEFYLKAYKFGKSSKKRQRALFNSAFISYQFKDYKRAISKFHEILKKYKRSKIRKEVYWYLSWVYYLNKNYEQSIKYLNKIKKFKKNSRYKKYWAEISDSKIDYWIGMNQFRLKKFNEAKNIFINLVQNPLLDYYTFSSYQRLKQVQYLIEIDDQKNKQDLKREPASNFMNKRIPAFISNSFLPLFEKTNNREEREDEFFDNKDKESKEQLSSEFFHSYNEDYFNDVKLKELFNRSNALVDLGFYDLANWELYEIEMKTKDISNLNFLMEQYYKIKKYHRAAYISEVYFENQRKNHGIKGLKELWKYAYPPAFSDIVQQSSKHFNISVNLIWSIIRAETFFRSQTASSVGALGLMQVMPFTGEKILSLLDENKIKLNQDKIKLTTDTLMDPFLNVHLGTRYLKRLSKKFKSQIPLMAAGYNAGPHRVKTWLYRFGDLDMDEFIEHIPFLETRNYTKKVIKNYGVYETLYARPPINLSWLSLPVGVKSEIPSMRENWEPL